jgi:hypothetical protein
VAVLPGLPVAYCASAGEQKGSASIDNAITRATEFAIPLRSNELICAAIKRIENLPFIDHIWPKIGYNFSDFRQCSAIIPSRI